MRIKIQRYFANFVRPVPTGADGVARITARQIYILPTYTGMIFGTVVMIMLMASLNYQNNLGLLFAFFLAAIGIIAMHHAWFNLLKLAIQIRGGSPVFAGETATFEITLHAEAHRSHYDIQIRNYHLSQPFFTENTATETKSVQVPMADQCVVLLNTMAPKRGQLKLNMIVIETRHPMQLFRAWCYVKTTAATLVYPQPVPHAPAPLLDNDPARRTQQRRRNSGVEDYLGSRPYRPGDSPHHIDWKAFARERGLVVKQFGSDQGQTVWLDWAHLNVPDSELRLRILARQVLDSHANTVRFGLRLPGVTEPPAQGAAQVQRCLTHLALFNGG